MKRVDVAALTGSNVLVGRDVGSRHLEKYVAAAAESSAGETLLWDWSGVELTTASYLAATIVPLIRRAIARELDVFSVVTGLNEHALEELKVVLNAEHLPVLLAEKEESGNITQVRLLGDLNPAYRDTFLQIVRRERVSATELYNRVGTSHGIGKTGWLNRLATLNQLRLVRRTKVGREFVYKPAHLEA